MDLVRRISALPPEKLALLRSRLQQKGGEASSPITRLAQDPQGRPLSFAQERLWFINQLQPGSPMYNIPATYRFQGPLNVPMLERALGEIARRHEALRTVFAVVDGRPVQRVAASPTALRRIDLRALPAERRQAEMHRLVAEESALAFDLTAGPLLRATLIEADDADSTLLVVMHHIASDGWSLGVFARELGELYDAFSAGRPSPLPELPIQYADFAQWQRSWLQGERLERPLSYWKRHLAGAPAVAALPTDRSRKPVQSFRGAVHSFTVPAPVSETLKALGHEHGATLFMTLIAAFMTLLYRCSGREDQVVGTLVANRNRTDIEGLIGFFVNTLALRVDLSGNPSFREVLRRVRGTTLDAYAHQELPFERLVEELQPERTLSYHPLVQVLFVLQNTPMPGGSAAAPDDLGALGAGTAKFDLVLFMAEAERGLIGLFEYSTDLFDAATVEEMAELLARLLSGVAADPDRPIIEVALRPAEGEVAGEGPAPCDLYAAEEFLFELPAPGSDK